MRVVTSARLRAHDIEGTIDAPRVDPDESDSLGHEPRRGVAAQPRVTQLVPGLVVVAADVGAYEDDVVRLELVPDPVERRPHVVLADALHGAVALAKIEHDAVAHEPAEGHLVDGARRAAGRRGVVVVGRVDVGP